MNAQPNLSKKGILSRQSFWFVIVALAAVAGISYATINNRLQENPLRNQPTYEVQQGPLTISVDVAGTIQARNKEIIKNELEGSSTILFIIPEGNRVKTGDILVELDVSNLIDQRVDQEIKVQNAEAAFINARENLAIVESQAQSDIDKADLVFEFAKQDLRKYLEGEFPKLEKESLSMIKQREEELNLAQEKVKWSKILFDQKYLSQSELQTDVLSATRIQIQKDLAQTDLELLQQFTYKRQIAQLVSDVSQADMALERTKRQANANIVQASAALQAKISEYQQEQNKLQKINDQIGKAVIKAPMDGLVVYATSVQMGRRMFGGNDQPLQEGRQVREREELIHLPTTSSYMAEVKLQESSLEKVRIGMPVRITVDAVPGKVFTGKVATIAPLPNAQSIFMNPDLKVYDSQVFIDGNGDELRSGMGCEAAIIVDYFEDAVYVPIPAVLRIGDKFSVYVAKENQWEQRTVELGLDNNRLAQIKSGLKKGEIVWTNPPLSSAEVSGEDRFKNADDIPQILKEAKENQAANPLPQPGSEMGRPSQPGADQAMPGMDGANSGRRSGGGRTGGGRPDFENMTPEQREQMRQRFQNRQPGEGQPGGGQMGGGQMGGGRPDFQNMTPEQREQMRQRFQNMSQEERDAMRQRSQQNGGQPPRRGGQEQAPQQGGSESQ
ncbi:MAG: efflux RND transporter periplasmic adaptor subunit [Candidatus Omnitrophota bacterium]